MSPLPPTRERPVTSAGIGSLASSEQQLNSPSGMRRWLRRASVVLVVVLAVVLGAVAAALFYAKHEIDDFVKADTPVELATQKELKAALPGRATNILLLGSDHRTGTAATDRRSDTLMLMRLDPKRKSISLLSFPRDTYVPIPGHGSAKINDAYALGGPALSVRTIKDLTGLDVNFVVDVDFKGFRGVVDAFGGIWVDVDQRYYVPKEADYMEIDLQPGYQLLDGRDALAFARHRYSDSDFYRIGRQQMVLAGLKKQVAASSKANSIPALFKVMRDNASIVGGGGKGVPARSLYDYMRLATSLSARDVYQVEFEGGSGEVGTASVVTYEKSKLDAAVQAFLAPDAKAREATADQLVGKQKNPRPEHDSSSTEKSDQKPSAPDPSTVSVRVLNGSGVGGIAGNVSSQLVSAGYKVDPNPSNADRSTYASTKVLYASDANKPAAEALAAKIPGATTGPKDASNPFSTMLLVIVGKTGTQVKNDGTGPIGVENGPTGGVKAKGNVVPEKASAKVINDSELAKSEFLEIRSSRMPVLYPTVHEQTASYTDSRWYQYGRGQQVYDNYRLVAKLGTGIDYYGIQGTSWSNPPILDDPTREVVRNGRNYRLYFNGTKLHMIAWRQGAGTYWVSNSVLDKLSNETMLAIADGVKVLPRR